MFLDRKPSLVLFTFLASHRRQGKVLLLLFCLCTTLSNAQTLPPANHIYEWPTSAGGNDHTYMVIETATDTWTEAKTLSSQYGGYLVTITSVEEQGIVLNLLQTSGAPIGLYWLGLKETATEGQWVWDNGDPLSYTNWNSGQPDNTGGNETRGHIYRDSSVSKDGTWNDLPENPVQLFAGYIVELPFLLSALPFNFSLDYHYNPANGHVYRLTPQAGTALEGQDYAVNHMVGNVQIPGNLATIRNQPENDWLFGIFGNQVTIGLNDMDQEGTWEWISGEPAVFINWRPNEPNNNYPSGENWAEFDSVDGQWNDTWESNQAIIEFVPPCAGAYDDGDNDGVPEVWEDNNLDGDPDGFPVTCPIPVPHSADQNGDFVISLSELLRVIQFFNIGLLHCDVAGEDGFNPDSGDTSCTPHNSDYSPQDWSISLTELLRMIQFFNLLGYLYCPGVGEDGFCPLGS